MVSLKRLFIKIFLQNINYSITPERAWTTRCPKTVVQRTWINIKMFKTVNKSGPIMSWLAMQERTLLLRECLHMSYPFPSTKLIFKVERPSGLPLHCSVKTCVDILIMKWYLIKQNLQTISKQNYKYKLVSIYLGHPCNICNFIHNFIFPHYFLL